MQTRALASKNNNPRLPIHHTHGGSVPTPGNSNPARPKKYRKTLKKQYKKPQQSFQIEQERCGEVSNKSELSQDKQINPTPAKRRKTNASNQFVGTPTLSQEEQPDLIINSLLCPVCCLLIASTVESSCGHNYCQKCLNEYLLVCEECPVCERVIRDKKLSYNKKLDEIIEEFALFMGQGFKQFLKRKEDSKDYKNQKNPKIIEAGAAIDVRDENYIWHQGLITRVFNRIHDETKIKFITVMYSDSGRKEEFQPSSQRLAKAGYYTSRTDIPRRTRQTITSYEPADTPRIECRQ